ncbi:hypothetical protein ROZALSC1DRAFT_26824, partial [Rozella allomycis CSF55]
MIKKLDFRLTSTITSGQVIPEVSSFIKELVDNSLDANATYVDIKFFSAPTIKIEVSDNGTGISPDDFLNLGKKNFTSKICNIEDLQNVQSLGFRGEALNSICTLSQVSIRTATLESSPKGFDLKLNHMGDIDSKSLCARELVQEFSICYPMINFKYSTFNKNNETVHLVTKSNDLNRRINDYFGTKNLREFSKSNTNLNLSCIISTEGQEKNRLVLMINKRIAESKLILSLLKQASKENEIKPHFIFLSIELRQRDVDFNLDPNKRNVMFRDDDSIFNTLKAIMNEIYQEINKFKEVEQVPLKRRMEEIDLPMKAVKMDVTDKQIASGRLVDQYEGVTSLNDFAPCKAPSVSRESNLIIHKKNEVSLVEVNQEDFARMKIIGQFNHGFIITKLKQGSKIRLFIIDQHASDEKYNFEMLNKYSKIQTQHLISPKEFSLTPASEQLIWDSREEFEKFGFNFIFEKNNTPGQRLSSVSVPTVIQSKFDSIFSNWNDISETIDLIQKEFKSYYATKACRKSVMIGTPLNNFQMRKIIKHLEQLDQPWNCPHGRPTIRHLLDFDE